MQKSRHAYGNGDGAKAHHLLLPKPYVSYVLSNDITRPKASKRVAASAAPGARKPRAWATGAEGIPARSRWCLGIIPLSRPEAAGGPAGKQRIVKRGVHTGGLARQGEATAGDAAPERVVGAQARWMQVVMADAVGRASRQDDARKRLIELELILEAGRREVGHRGAGARTSHLGERIAGRQGLTRKWLLAMARMVWIAELLGAALRAGGFLGLGGFDAAFLLEFGNEFLHNLDFEGVKEVCKTTVA